MKKDSRLSPQNICKSALHIGKEQVKKYGLKTVFAIQNIGNRFFYWSNRLPCDQTNPFAFIQREETCLWGFANNKGTHQPAHRHSLISTFVIHLLESIISNLATREISNKNPSWVWGWNSKISPEDCCLASWGLQSDDERQTRGMDFSIPSS